MWADDEHIVYGTRRDGVWVISLSGGSPELLLPSTSSESLLWPFVLPGGRIVLLSQRSAFGLESGSVLAFSLETKKLMHEVIGNAADAMYSDGRLFFGRNDALWSAPFDPVTATVTGDAEVAIANVERAPGNGETQYAVAPNGTIAFVSFQKRRTKKLEILDRAGRPTTLLTPEAADYLTMSLSPLGDRIAMPLTAQGRQLVVVSLQGQPTIRIQAVGAGNGLAWLPNGDRIAYAGGPGFAQILSVRADGVGGPQSMTSSSDSGQDLLDISANGDVFYIEQLTQWTSLLVQPSSGPVRSMEVPPFTRWLRVARGGRAFVSEAQGVITRQGTESQASRVRVGAGRRPIWSRNGTRIFFLRTNSTSTTTLASVAGDGIGPATGHFPCERCVEVEELPDGRFAVLRQAGEPNPAATIHVILPWQTQPGGPPPPRVK
jgi:hypothetical protein